MPPLSTVFAAHAAAFPVQKTLRWHLRIPDEHGYTLTDGTVTLQFQSPVAPDVEYTADWEFKDLEWTFHEPQFSDRTKYAAVIWHFDTTHPPTAAWLRDVAWFLMTPQIRLHKNVLPPETVPHYYYYKQDIVLWLETM